MQTSGFRIALEQMRGEDQWCVLIYNRDRVIQGVHQGIGGFCFSDTPISVMLARTLQVH